MKSAKIPDPKTLWPAGVAVGLLALGFFCGWQIGGKSSPTTSAQVRRAPATPAIEARGVAQAKEAATEATEFLTRVHVALTLPNPFKRERALYEAVAGLDASQIRAVLAHLQKARLPGRKELLAQIYARWGEIEPDAALEFARALTSEDQRNEATQAIVRGWLDNDPAAAKEWIARLPAGAVKESATTALIIAEAAADPAHALQLAGAAKLSRDAAKSLGDMIFLPWTQSNPREAAAAAARLPESALRAVALDLVARQWAEADPNAAIAWTLELPRGARDFDRHSLGAWYGSPMTSVIETWIDGDSDGLLKWLQDLPDDGKKPRLIDDALTFGVENRHDLALAEKLTALMPEGKGRDYTLAQCADRLAMHDQAGTLAWVKSQADGQLEGQMLGGMLPNLSGDNLREALQEIQRLNAAGGTQISLTQLSFGPGSTPQVAADWAVQQPNNDEYLRKVTAVWMTFDPNQAKAWVDSLPSPAKEKAALGLVPRKRPPGR